MTPAILARFQKRTYAEYDYKRTRDIWPSRDALLEYERALIKEFEIDEILAGKGASTIQRGRSMASKTPAPLYERIGTTPPPTPSSAAYDAVSSQAGGSLSHKRPKGKGVPEEETPRQRDAQLVKKLFESVYDEWKALVLVKPEQESVRTNGLERFDCGESPSRPHKSPRLSDDSYRSCTHANSLQRGRRIGCAKTTRLRIAGTRCATISDQVAETEEGVLA